MNRIDRLFGILTTIQSKKFVPAEVLADKYSISTRTVYRDIKALCELGIPVSFEAQKGYFIVQGYFLPPLSLNAEEANALLLIEAVVEAFTDKSIRKHYGNLLVKLKAAMRSSQKEKLEDLTQNIRLQIPSCFRSDFDYLSQLQEAISAKMAIRLDYCNADGQRKTRLVEPIGLFFYALNWHLIAWCWHRQAYRDFRVGRINAVSNTGIPFRKNDHISLAEYHEQIPVNF